MAEQSFPFENIDTTESQFSEWATNFQETGVQGSPTGTELGITVTGSDLNLTIAAGQAFIRGHYYINTSDLVLAVPSAGVNTRIDIVVVELDPEGNTIVTKIVSGTAVAADPVAPTLTQSATGIYQLPISTLTIPTSTVAITAGMLVDTRTFMGHRVGIWTTATRPANPTAYQTLGYNTTSEIHEYWNGSTWGSFSPDLSGLIPKSIVTTSQDLIVADGASSVTRLGVGANDQVLSVVAGSVAWADAGGGGIYGNLIASGTISASLTISSIPATYKDLILVLQSFDSDGATPEMTVNGISSDYAEVILRASSRTSQVGRNRSGFRLAEAPGNNSVVYANFLGYSLTTGYKTVNISWSGAWKGDNQALNTTRTFGGVPVTGAISSMSFSNLGSVGTYALYGVN